MVAVSAVLLVTLLFCAWRRAAWGVALLGIAVGISASGPIADGLNAGIQAGTSLVNSIDGLI